MNGDAPVFLEFAPLYATNVEKRICACALWLCACLPRPGSHVRLCFVRKQMWFFCCIVPVTEVLSTVMITLETAAAALCCAWCSCARASWLVPLERH